MPLVSDFSAFFSSLCCYGAELCKIYRLCRRAMAQSNKLRCTMDYGALSSAKLKLGLQKNSHSSSARKSFLCMHSAAIIEGIFNSDSLSQ